MRAPSWRLAGWLTDLAAPRAFVTQAPVKGDRTPSPVRAPRKLSPTRPWAALAATLYGLALLAVSGIGVGAAEAQGADDASQTVYVIADAAMLREDAEEDADVRAVLRIGTPLMLLASDDAGLGYDGWSRVAPRANPGLIGYVASGLTSRRPPSVEDLRADLDATLAGRDLVGAQVAAERLVALRPDDRMALVDLMEIAAARGDEPRADALRAYQRGRSPKGLAYCRAQAWNAYEGPYALGLHAPESTPITPPDLTNPRWRLAERGADPLRLQSAAWFADDRGLVARLDDTDWTLTPGVRLSAGLDQPSLGAPSQDARSVCATPGVVRSTEEFVRLPRQSTSVGPWRDVLIGQPELGLKPLAAFGARAGVVPDAGGLIAVETTYERSTVCPRCSGAVPTRVKSFALIEPETKTVLVSRGYLAGAEADPTDLVFVHAVSWGRWSSSGQVFAIVEWEDARPGPGGGPFIDWLVFDLNGLVDGGTFVVDRRGLETVETEG